MGFPIAVYMPDEHGPSPRMRHPGSFGQSIRQEREVVGGLKMVANESSGNRGIDYHRHCTKLQGKLNQMSTDPRASRPTKRGAVKEGHAHTKELVFVEEYPTAMLRHC
jgi:hypothetical protein